MDFDFNDFDSLWLSLGIQICQAIYNHDQVKLMKISLLKKGFLSLEEKSNFLNVCDKIKYEFIYHKFGPEGSEGYKNFSTSWQEWFKQKGVESQKDRNLKKSVDHILFGSTPDPVQFLLYFQKELEQMSC